MNKKNKTEYNLVLILIILVITVNLFFIYLYGFSNTKDNFDILEKQTENYFPSFYKLDLEAEAIYIWDVNKNEVLFAQKEKKPLPIASIAKVMTALISLDEMERNTIITISDEALSQSGDNGLYAGEKWILTDLIKFMLVSSSNDAAQEIALKVNEEHIKENILCSSLEDSEKDENKKCSLVDSQFFVGKMNQKARILGLEETEFFNSTGLDFNGHEGGSYSSAEEVAILFNYALLRYSDIFEVTASKEITFESLSGFSHTIENTNKIIEAIPSLTASKTGLTNLAGGNLVISFEVNPFRPVIIVILGSTEIGRFSDFQKILSATLAEIK